MDKYCDIVPHPAGWTYILNGIESDCSFHTYELAVEAAKIQVMHDARKRVFRLQGLNGEMLPFATAITKEASRLG
ncbi:MULTISPECIES: hypothetical protein [Pseudorhizobium]|jgi:hypothetical protein|uniref:hypothetical protein n=1 Tax=Pseudorhizobium TaxID=1903858 RepID=UPI000497108B|nr:MULTISPECIES: hypothetical protein [Pseudorhizobium]MBA4785020.1 hypothetical protein [Hyphomicrobiales bacterium]MBU1316898.1 hypothetical protein [Alphaproteobacteria bacterium]MDY6961927.1 hypothetical protein [Pseudomonadota bacterium]MBU1548183.1 hypothetical protein [Alphaproteobacteria bacterium]MBU2336055.1 hypothetical protein [Alphaproteobacteria bacterium]|tara:strand:+ start:4406 stop:4630 length:225 start_codon:yes stop_codon:yes gene_type:complete